MANPLSELFVRISADMSGLDKELKKTVRQVQFFGDDIKSVGSEITGIGTRLTAGLTLPIIGAGVGALKASIDWEQAMAGVAKTVDLPAAEIERLGEQFQGLSEKIPVSANELARIGEAAGQLGIETQHILGFTRTMADLGVATNMSSDQASDALARLANITQMPQTEFGRLGSTIVALGNNLAATESELVDFGLRIAGAGAIAGLSEADILSIGGAMASVGVEAEAGGTAVQKVLLGMTESVATGNKSLATFAATAGLSAQEFARLFKEDAAQAFTLFVEGLGQQGNKAFQTLEALDLQDQRLIRSFLSLAGAGDLLRTSVELGNTAWQENTALSKEAERFYGTLGNQLVVLRNKLANTAAELGQALRPALELVIEKGIKPLLEQVRQVVEWFAQLDPKIQVVAVAFAGVLAAIGPVLVIVGTLITSLGAVVAASGALAGVGGLAGIATAAGAVLSPIGAVVGIVGGLTAAVILAWKESETFREVVTEVWDAIKETVVDVSGKVSLGITALKDLWREYGDDVKRVWDTSIQPTIDILGTAFETAFRVAGGAILVMLALIRGDFRAAGTELLEIVKTIVDGIIEAFSESHLGQAVEKVTTFVNGVRDKFQGLKDTLVGNSIIPDLVTAVGANFQQMAGDAVGHMQTMGQGVIREAEIMVSGTLTAAERLAFGLRAIFSNIALSVDQVVGALQILTEGDASGAFGKLSQAAGTGTNAFIGFAKQGFGALVQAMQEGGQEAATLGTALGSVGGTAKATVSELDQLIKSLKDQAATSGLNERSLLAYRLEVLKADPATRDLALSLHDTAVEADAKAEALRKASDAIAANRERVNGLIASLGEEYRSLTMSSAELLTYELRQLNAGEADIRAALAKQEEIEALKTQIRVSQELGKVWQEQLDAMNVATEKMRDTTLGVMNELSGGFFGRMKDSWTGLTEVVEKALGPAAGGAMEKVSGFASGLLSMAGPAGMAFQAVDAIGNLFGINLSGIISSTLGKAWKSVTGFFKDMLGLGGPSPSYERAEKKVKNLPKEWQEAFKAVEQFGDLSKLGPGEDWRAIAEIAQSLHEHGNTVQEFLDFFDVTAEDMKTVWDDLQDILNIPVLDMDRLRDAALNDIIHPPGQMAPMTNTAISSAASTPLARPFIIELDGRVLAKGIMPFAVDEARMVGGIRNA